MLVNALFSPESKGFRCGLEREPVPREIDQLRGLFSGEDDVASRGIRYPAFS